MGSYQRTYSDEDGLTPVKSRPSTRRFQPPTSADDVMDDARTIEIAYVEPVRYPPMIQRATRGKSMSIQDELTRRPRPQTSEDIAIDLTRVQPAPARVSAKSKKNLRTKIILFGCSALIAGGMLFSFLESEAVYFADKFQEGYDASTSITGVYGHRDSSKSPTEIQASVQRDGRINVIEFPGEDIDRAHGWQSSSLRDMGYDGPLNDVYLQIHPEEVEGKWQIRINITAQEVGVFPKTFEGDLLLVDSGKGYFVGATAK